MYRTALITAGGKRPRMGSEPSKQFLPTGGKPALMHTLRAPHRFDRRMQLILVLSRGQQGFWRELCEMHQFNIRHEIVDRGETRLHPVKNGLALINGIGGMVGVHDGVRPFVLQEVIARCSWEAVVRKAVISVIDVVEIVRRLTGPGSETVNRNGYKLVQTPQVFDIDLLRRVCEQEFTPLFTDDASVVEAMEVLVHLVEGNRENIKITIPFDLKVALALL